MPDAPEPEAEPPSPLAGLAFTAEPPDAPDSAPAPYSAAAADPAPPDAPIRGSRKVVIRALIALAAVGAALATTLALLDGRGAEPGGTAGGEPDPDGRSERASGTVFEALPEDYACAAYDVAAFEDFAGGPVNEEYALANSYPVYLDMYGTGMLHCEFLVGEAGGGVEAGVTVWAEPDADAAAASLAWERENWEAAEGTVEDYSGPAGAGFLFTDANGYLMLCVLDGATIASADLNRVPDGQSRDDAVAMLLDLADQGRGIYAEQPAEWTDLD